MAHWAESARQLREIIQGLGDRLDAKTGDLVVEFVEHNEVGVALEWIYDYLEDGQVRIPGDVPGRVSALAEHMGMDSRDWSRLARLGGAS